MNKHTTAHRRLLLLAPALSASSVYSGLAISVCVLAIVLATAAAKILARKMSDPSARYVVLLVVAAAASAGCDVLLRAFAWPFQADVQPWLPFIAVTSIFVAQQFEKRQAQAVTSDRGDIYTIAVIIAAPLLIGTAREVSGALLFSLAATVIIGTGLLIAATNRWKPHRDDCNQSPDQNQKKSRRMRVTGPIS
jgi:Na+-translocating ferredoxin:NAD+ oxidoreductase RnfE subunit